MSSPRSWWKTLAISFLVLAALGLRLLLIPNTNIDVAGYQRWYDFILRHGRFLALVPFLLPKMHDRYFYPADVLASVLAFYRPKSWFIPLAYQVISILAYSVFLFDAPRQIALVLAVQLNTFVLAYLIWKQSRLLQEIA